MTHKIQILLLLGLLLILPAYATAQDYDPGSIIAEVTDNASLRCGVNPELLGFAEPQDDGSYVGFDVDFCRAVAAAITGDADAVEYVPLEANRRAFALQLGEVHMLSRNTTWTLSRNTEWNSIFGPTVFYDGASVMVRSDSNIDQLAGLEGANICVAQGTTTELNIRDTLDTLGVTYELIGQPDTNTAFDEFIAGNCDAMTTDKSGLAALKAGLDEGVQADYTIFAGEFSEEPLGPLSPDRDPEFAEVVTWVVYGMILAEELDITSENVDDLLESDDPAIQRFLGQGGQPSGELLGIRNDFMYQVISQVGNYEEVYTTHLGDILPDRGKNSLYTEGGLLYAPPFR